MSLKIYFIISYKFPELYIPGRDAFDFSFFGLQFYRLDGDRKLQIAGIRTELLNPRAKQIILCRDGLSPPL